MTNLRALLSKNIKKKRDLLGLSQAELAEKAGTSTNYVAQIEQMNKFPSVEMLERIAEALEMDSTDLFDKGAFPMEAVKRFYEGLKTDFDERFASLVKDSLNVSVPKSKKSTYKK